MDTENKRKYERVETKVKVKLPGDAKWTECPICNVSNGGLLFEAARKLGVGNFVSLQFILQSKSGTLSNVHFFASARVVRIIPKPDIYQIAVQFILDDEVRKELVKVISMIKGQNLNLDRPTTSDVLFRKIKSE